MYKKFGKRILDFIMALVLLLVLWPILLIIALLIKIDSKGSVLFKQIRTGRYGKEFTLYKFRSMSSKNDFYDTTKEDQVTKVGKFIRKTSLDELPQIFNIIKGDMSFIGPRPWIVDYAKLYTKHQRKRLNVLPGITGLAQCSGRNNLNIIDRINIDVDYVNNMSLKLDIYIFIKTILSVIKKEGFSNSKLAIHEELRTLKNQHKKNVHRVNTKRRNRKSTITNSINKINKKDEKVLVGSGV